MVFKRSAPLIIVLLILTAGIIISNHLLNSSEKLRFFNPADVNSSLVDSSLRNINKFHRIADFELINQDGKVISQKDFEGKIYVADFFFTTCPSICPKMSTQMQRVYEKFSENNNVMLLSHTVMPEVDSVPVLAAYAKTYNAGSKKWMFATGEKKKIYELARKSYFAVTDRDSPGTADRAGDEHDFIHTENFILVDKNKRIRGFYDGTSVKEVDRLIEEIEILMKE